MKPNILHIYSCRNANLNTVRRMEVAHETWRREQDEYGQWLIYNLSAAPWVDNIRNATEIGEEIGLPFIRDMIRVAAEMALDNDIILITNADICLVPNMGEILRDACEKHGSAYAHRWDFPLVKTHISRGDVSQGKWYVSCDLFAFTGSWWKQHGHAFPDFILGRECWDWAFRLLIDETKGVSLERAIYHEKHPSPWEMHRGLPGNLWNRGLMRRFLQERNLPLAEIDGLAFTPPK